MSDKKGKSFSVLKESWLKEKLDVNWDELGDASTVKHIHIFYTLLPKVAEGLKTVTKMERSFSWKPAGDAEQLLKHNKNQVTFGLLVPRKLVMYMSKPPSNGA